MPSLDDHQELLQDWIASATEDLTGSAAQRLKEEFEDHYATAHTDALESGKSDGEAHADAMAALGDSRSAYLAAIPVHGDPYRLRMKAGLMLTGIALVLGSLYYKETLPDPDEYYTYTLWQAVKAGDIGGIRRELQNGIDPNAEGRPNFSILHHALSHEYPGDNIVDILQLLLEHGADPNALDQFGRTPLFYLIHSNPQYENLAHYEYHHFENKARNRTALFDLLIQHGADPRHHSSFQDMSLMEYTSLFGDPIIIGELSNAGVQDNPRTLLYQDRFDEVMAWAERDPEILTTLYGQGVTIPQLLISQGRLPELKRAIELGANLEQPDFAGRGALHHAFAYGDRGIPKPSLELVSYLIESGCDVNFQDSHQNTPLHTAASTSGIELINLLLDKGADPTIKNRWDITPLHMSTIPNRLFRVESEEEVALALIEAGADVNAVTAAAQFSYSAGNTPLHFAVWCNMPQVIRVLVEQGAFINQPNEEGDMPIHYAVDYAYHYEYYGMDLYTILDLLLELGADINARGARGNTPLYVACGNCRVNCDFETTRYLLERGADPTIPNFRGQTPLHTDVQKMKELFKEFGYETTSKQEVARH